jgi:heat shock protein HtpX
MYSAIARNKRNTVFIILFFFVLIGGLGLLASAIYGSPTIVIVTLVIAAAYVLFQYYLATSQSVALSGAVEIHKADNPRLWNTVENLAIATGSPMPKVYIVDDPAPNAFATGRDPEHAIVAATTGLLDIMDNAELEGVMAHELGHVRNYDIRVSMIVFGLVVAVGFIADMFLRMAFFGGRGNNSNPIVLIFGFVAVLVAPLVASMVQMAISRQRECLADATGAITTRHPDALSRALQKLAENARPLRRQNTSMSHLWISSPLEPGIVARLFSTHPPITERIERLHTMGRTF